MPEAKVKTPDGRVLTLRVPEGATQEQILRFAKTQSETLAEEQKSKSRREQSFPERFGEDVKERLQTQQKIRQQRPDGIGGKIVGGLREAGEVGAGTILDLVGEGSVSAFRALTDPLENKLRSAGTKTAEFIAEKTPLDELARFGAEKFQKFDEANPNIGGLLKSGANISGVALPFSRVKPKIPKGDRVPIEEIVGSGGEKFEQAGELVRERFRGIEAKEAQLFDEAKMSGRGTDVSGDFVSKIPDRVESMLLSEGNSLQDEALKPLAEQINKLSKLKRSPVRSVGDLPEGGELKTIEVPELLGIRKNISNLAKSNDGTLRNAAGKALKEFDNSLMEFGEQSILSGDSQAIDKAMEAIAFSRQKFKDFGTDKRKGQNVLFENVITKNPLNNSQFADTILAHKTANAFGKGSAGKEATPEFVARLLDNSGDQREFVRQNLRDGFVFKAIEKAKKQGDGGEILINPSVLAREMNRLRQGTPGAQGLGPIRDAIFTKNELDQIKNFVKQIQNPQNIRGGAKELARVIPFIGNRITPRKISDQRRARMTTEEFITEFTEQAQRELAGKPIEYGSIVLGTQALTED